MKSSRRVARRLWWGGSIAVSITLAVFLLWSCGGDSSTGSEDNNQSGLIGPGGGTFVDPTSGVAVVVPPGALSTETQITCTRYADESEIPDSMLSSIFGPLGVVCLGPDGTQFDSAVTVTVPVSDTLTPGEQFPLFVWNESNDSWEQTEFTCTASADGLSYSTEVTHFSSFSSSNGYGSDGIFGNLDPATWLDVESAFNAWIGSFCWDLSFDNTKQMKDCCMGVTGLKFTMDYRGAITYPDEDIQGDINNYDFVEHFEVTRGEIGTDYYLHLTADVYWSCMTPDPMSVTAFPAEIDLTEQTAHTSEITAFAGCGGHRMGWVQVAFAVDGPGSVNPTTCWVSPDGYAHTTYTATDTGTATITGTMTSCQEFGNPQTAFDTTVIRIDSCTNWGVIVELTFDHETDNFTFHDDITMHIPLMISPTGEITSSGGAGTHSASLSTTAPDCSVTQSITPDFVPGAQGSVIGPNMYLTIAPVSGWALLYTLTCIVDDQPVDVPLPPYNYLLPSIMAGQIFDEFPLALEKGAFARGSGSDTQWGEDYPITYEYYIIVYCD